MSGAEEGQWSSGEENSRWDTDDDDSGGQKGKKEYLGGNKDSSEACILTEGMDESLQEGEKHQEKKHIHKKIRLENCQDCCEKETVKAETSKNTQSNIREGSLDIRMKTGGVYIPLAKLKKMQEQIKDKNNEAYQRIAWEALKKSINGHVNKINVSNMAAVVRDLLKENVVRGRGVLVKSLIQAQSQSPVFSAVYAALAAILNTKFPQICELLLTRLILQFRSGFRRNDKDVCVSSTRFIAHLINQQVSHEVLALEILTLLLGTPTDDSVEVSVNFLRECGMKLNNVSPRAMHEIFGRLGCILHEGQVDKRVQYMIEVLFAIRKDGFKDHSAIPEGLDLVEETDQNTHLLSLDEPSDPQDFLNVFKHDPDYEANEEKYRSFSHEILEESSDDEWVYGSSDSESEADTAPIIDSTQNNLKILRKTIYLTINSSLDVEECAHKLLKMNLKPEQEFEICNMILDTCAQQRSYEKFYGVLAQKFCSLHNKYVVPFERLFKGSYDTIHRLETDRLRNVTRFFAHLLLTDSISWFVLSHIKLNEDETTSSSRIFIKILFQDLAESMGLSKLYERTNDPTFQTAFAGLFPRDNPRHTRFAINFYTSIGLGGLTEELRIHIKIQPKLSEKSESSDSSDVVDDGFWGDMKPEVVKASSNNSHKKRKRKKDAFCCSKDDKTNSKANCYSKKRIGYTQDRHPELYDWSLFEKKIKTDS